MVRCVGLDPVYLAVKIDGWTALPCFRGCFVCVSVSLGAWRWGAVELHWVAHALNRRLSKWLFRNGPTSHSSTTIVSSPLSSTGASADNESFAVTLASTLGQQCRVEVCHRAFVRA